MEFLIESSGGSLTECQITSVEGSHSAAGLRSIDLLLRSSPSSNPELLPKLKLDQSSEVQLFLREKTEHINSKRASSSVNILIKLLFADKTGYPVRSDLFERRFEGCDVVSEARSFSKVSQSIAPMIRLEASIDFLQKNLDHVVGALSVIITSTDTVDHALRNLDRELTNRLSYKWLLSTPAPKKRIGWVQGRQDYQSIGRAYESARALGISLVIFDEPGHWLEDDNGPYTYLREAFVSMSIQLDEGLTERIVDAVKGCALPLDGLVTISDARLPRVAAACEVLGLPTELSSAYFTAADKGETRRLEMQGTEEKHLVVSSSEELDSILANGEWWPSYPLIVKPTMGWNSDCVTKCNNVDELRAAVSRASSRHATSPLKVTTVVIEPYISGPEVDANMVLLDGEVLFIEAEDDFPSTADSDKQSKGVNFMETQVVIPSKLPRRELDMLEKSMKASILRHGFRSGVFHCEARVRNSSAHYVESNGIHDMEITDRTTERQPSMYLHEINSRPPGYIESVAVMLAYGIDYYAIRLLLSLGSSESERIKALSQPYRQGPQFHLSMSIIPATQDGIMETEDAVLEFFEKYPKYKDHVIDHNTAKKRGDLLQGPESGELWWIAYLSVISRTSREELLSRTHFVRENLTYEIE